MTTYAFDEKWIKDLQEIAIGDLLRFADNTIYKITQVRLDPPGYETIWAYFVKKNGELGKRRVFWTVGSKFNHRIPIFHRN